MCKMKILVERRYLGRVLGEKRRGFHAKGKKKKCEMKKARVSPPFILSLQTCTRSGKLPICPGELPTRLGELIFLIK